MKSFIKNFCLRGMIAAWGGPVIVAIVYAVLHANGVIDTLTADEVVRGILSSVVLAFIAAGISCIYQQEKLPLPMMIAVQAVVLYLDYLLIYLFNGWLLPENVWIFTLIFAAGYAVIWLCIYFVERKKISRLNRKLKES